MTQQLDTLIELLTHFLPKCKKDADRLYESELRRVLFDATGMMLRLLVAGPEHLQPMVIASRLQHLQTPTARFLKASELAKTLMKRGDGMVPSVVGLHIIDPEIGRHSHIWLPPARPCPGVNDNPENWWKEYPTLWLRVYKQVLHPSTSLINAYEGKLLQLPKVKPLLIHWNPNGHPEYDHASWLQVVSLCDNSDTALAEFVRDTGLIVARFHETLVHHIRSGFDPHCETDLHKGSDKVVEQLRAKHVMEDLGLVRERYLLQLLDPGKARAAFLATLELLSAQEGSIPTQLRMNEGRWYGVERQHASEAVEILQTTIFNAPGFCSDLGLMVDQIPIGDAKLYLLLGFEKGYSLSNERCHDIWQMFSRGLESAFYSILHDKSRTKPPVTIEKKEHPVVKDVLRCIENPDCVNRTVAKPQKEGASSFISFAVALSREAVHESRELSFLLGYGHAEAPDLRCRKPIPIPEHLRRDSTDAELLVHFVKSRFSEFSRNDKILWFGRTGRCCGLYERAPEDPQEQWLDDWPDDCVFVRVTGKDQFDILQYEDTGGIPPRHRVRARVKGDVFVDLKSTTDIERRITLAGSNVFEFNPGKVQRVSELLACVTDRLREVGHGAGIVVANIDSTNDFVATEWRTGITEQEKRLVPDWGAFSEHDESRCVNCDTMSGDVMRDLVDEICAMAELDGAVFLRFESNSVSCRPARHFFPLISNNGKAYLQNFYKWADAGLQLYRSTPGLFDALRDMLQPWCDATERLKPSRGAPLPLAKLIATYHNDGFRSFKRFDLLQLYAACIRGLPELQPGCPVQRVSSKLAFLNSSGTRHHSLWGITVTAKERLFVISLSQDGRVSVFWDGRLVSCED